MAAGKAGGKGGKPGKADWKGHESAPGSSSKRSLSPAVPPRSRSPWGRKQGSWQQSGWQQGGWSKKK
eukprot:3585614-Pyramimonas_sp.AAC.1